MNKMVPDDAVISAVSIGRWNQKTVKTWPVQPTVQKYVN